jgi:transposase
VAIFFAAKGFNHCVQSSAKCSNKENSLEIGCHINPGLNWTKIYRKNFDFLQKVRSGRPRKTTAAQDARLLQAVRAKPITKFQELKGFNFFLIPHSK